ncbi:hypothetical protein [Saccharicrinis sp. FJH54]|uniref:hypothetical protein n=1 Tax=Saccharicrinis sp. FJH54 TaxID=3344665 RepID=UPI0035D528B9
MKTITKYRVLAMVLMVAFTLSGVKAQERNRARSNNHNTRDNRHEKVEQRKEQSTYKYKNYNYTGNHYKNQGPVVFNNRPVKYKHQRTYHKRLPVQTRPHLVVKPPRNFMAVHIDGSRYYVHNGMFYRHIPNRGFILVERPTHIKVLPEGVVKVRIKGNFYFKYHNILFEWTPWGYRIV